MEQACSTEEQSEAALWITAMITLQLGKTDAWQGSWYQAPCRPVLRKVQSTLYGRRKKCQGGVSGCSRVAYCVCEEGMALAAGELYRCQAGHVGSKVHQERTLQTRLVACPGVKNRRKMEESVMPVVLTD